MPKQTFKQWLWKGYAEAAAFGRQGHKELSQVLVAFPGQSVQPVEEPGTLNNPTSYEVTQQRAGEPSSPAPTESAFARWLAGRGRPSEAGPQPAQQRQMQMGE